MEQKTTNRPAGSNQVSSSAAGAEQVASARDVVLEDRELRVAFDAVSGALKRMERKSSQWVIERRPELAVSFRLLAPLPRRRANFILGENQHAAKVEKVADNQVRIVWKDPVSEHGGVVPLTLTATVTLENGVLTFNSELENNSELSIETVEYPYFGDMSSPTRDTPIVARHLRNGGLAADEIYPRFSNDNGYWGVVYFQKKLSTSNSQICLIQTPKQGIYVGMHDPAMPYLLQFIFELHPGYVTNEDVPQQDEISGLPVHIQFRACHFVFAHPHSSVGLSPVVIRTYSGDWHAGIDLYKEWRATWFTAPKTPVWATDIHSWMELQVETPVGSGSVPYRELASYGDECAKNGIAAIKLVGWSRGGNDRGGPSQDIEPGLGTRHDLRNAITQIQAQGVKTILSAQLYWADWTTDWYKKELYQYEVTDPHGNAYMRVPDGYITPTQLANMSRRRCSVMDVASPAYREIATREFEKIVALGAAGWFHSGVADHNALYSFHQHHGYTAPGYLYAADLPLSRQLHAAADQAGREFLFAGDAPQDWLMQYYPASYIPIHPNATLASRYLDSHAPLIVSVTGLDARETLNLILLYRCIISYKPCNTCKRLSDFPLTLAYGKKIDALRRRYREYLWDAEFLDNLGATVQADGASRYAVFRTAQGKRAVVVINMESRKAITAKLDLSNAGKLMSATPEAPDARPTSATLQIPARSAIAVMEQ